MTVYRIIWLIIWLIVKNTPFCIDNSLRVQIGIKMPDLLSHNCPLLVVKMCKDINCIFNCFSGHFKQVKQQNISKNLNFCEHIKTFKTVFNTVQMEFIALKRNE